MAKLDFCRYGWSRMLVEGSCGIVYAAAATITAIARTAPQHLHSLRLDAAQMYVPCRCCSSGMWG